MFKAKMARPGLGRDLGLVASAEEDFFKKIHNHLDYKDLPRLSAGNTGLEDLDFESCYVISGKSLTPGAEAFCKRLKELGDTLGKSCWCLQSVIS